VVSKQRPGVVKEKFIQVSIDIVVISSNNVKSNARFNLTSIMEKLLTTEYKARTKLKYLPPSQNYKFFSHMTSFPASE